MSKDSAIGVAFDRAEVRAQWVSELAHHLSGCRVVDAYEHEGGLGVLVVGNPPGTSLTRFEKVRFIQSAWAGVDRLLDGPPDVPIARMVAPELAGIMSEFVLTAVLALHRDLPKYRRAQSEKRWEPGPVRPVSRRTVGVLGYGELGRPAARRLVETGFDVMAWARSRREGDIPVVSGDDGLEIVLSRSEIVVNLLPLTPETRGILGVDAFGMMPRGSCVVNAARGAHVVESALLEALDGGRLSEAMLDVFDEEPLPPSHPYWSHPRVTVLPHVAAPSDPADLAPHVAANIARFLAGEAPRFLVR